jgi:hypothetical protein
MKLADSEARSILVRYGLAGVGGFGHCGCDCVGIRMAGDAAAALQIPECFALRMFFDFQPIFTAVNRFSRAQGRKASHRS